MILASAFLTGCTTHRHTAKILFTEKDFAEKGARVTLPEGPATYRITAEYSAKKSFSFTAKPVNNAFPGLSRKTFPASKQVRKVSHDFKVDSSSYGDMLLILSGGENCDIKKMTVETLPPEQYIPATAIPNPLRKDNGRHLQIKNDYKKSSQNPIILFGDSLTDNWRGRRFDEMKKNFPVINGGICGDRIEHLLWRIEDMREMLATNQPSVATFLVGTNNFNLEHDPEDIEFGVKNLITTLRSICPETKIIVFGVPPRGFPTRTDALPFPGIVNPLIENAVDELSSSGMSGLYYFDFSDLLVDGTAIRQEYYERDKLHFSDKGYAEVLTPFISGTIRLCSSNGTHDDFIKKMTAWRKYLEYRYESRKKNFAVEEMLACNVHLKDITKQWMSVFEKLATDPSYKPEMPHEFLRQSRSEGLPAELK